MTTTFHTASSFLRGTLPPEPWPGAIMLEAYQNHPKRRCKGRWPVNNPDHLDDYEEVEEALALHEQQGLDVAWTPAFMTDASQPGRSGPRPAPEVAALGVLWTVIPACTEDDLRHRADAAPVPAGAAVRTEHGGYLLWRLRECWAPDEASEKALLRVAQWVGGQQADPKQRLPLPGYGGALPLERWRRDTTVEEVLAAPLQASELRLPPEWIQAHIIEGHLVSGKDRTDTDRDIIRALLKATHTDAEIREVFERYPCGVQVQAKGLVYLQTMIEAIREDVGGSRAVRVWDNGALVLREGPLPGRRWGTVEVSNFCLVPRRRIVTENWGETVEWEVRHPAGVDVVQLPPAHYSTWTAACARIPSGCAWTSDLSTWQTYLRWLFDRGCPTERATPVVGWHGSEFVLPKETWFGSTLRHLALGTSPPRFEHAEHLDGDRVMREAYARCVDMRANVALATLGWFLAAAHAPRVRDAYQQQFPLLVLEGPSGSGKTTTARLLMQRLFGSILESERSMAGSVPTLRRSLQATNAVPVFLDEYQHRRRDEDAAKVDELLRLSFQRGPAPHWDNDRTQASEMPVQAPVVVATAYTVEDEQLRQRSHIIRIPPLPPAERGTVTPGERAVCWWDSLPHGGLLRWWLQQDPSAWVADIDRCKRLVGGQFRQQHAFGVVAAVLLWCAKRWAWPLTEADLVAWWTASADEAAAGGPFNAIDAGLARLVRKGLLASGQQYRVDGAHLVLHTSAVLDLLTEHCGAMDPTYPMSARWLQNTIRTGLQTGHVAETGKSKHWGRTERRCTVLPLRLWPAVAEAVGVR